MTSGDQKDLKKAKRIKAWFDTFEQHMKRVAEDEQLSMIYESKRFDFTFHRGDGHIFDLSSLADGYAAILALLAELFIRVETAQLARKDFTFMPDGVVIVDEIETHLHLSLQELILPFLTEIFPRFQFVVATHSPAVIASIPNAVVYDLKKRSQTLSDHFRGVRYGTMMTEHFGISSEIDLDSTEKLLLLRGLAARRERTLEEEKTYQNLCEELSRRSRNLAVEVWMIREKLGVADKPSSEDAA
jgi:predicted ATPase